MEFLRYQEMNKYNIPYVKMFEYTKIIGLENIECFWHSHPSNNLNLSLDDYAAFLKYPDHKHRIYSQTSFAEYYVRRGFVMRVENDFTIP